MNIEIHRQPTNCIWCIRNFMPGPCNRNEYRKVMTHTAMKALAHERYEQFDAQRQIEEARQANAEDTQALKTMEKQWTQSYKRKHQ